MNSLRRPANVLLATSLGLVLTGCASGGSPSSSNADGDAPPKPASRASSGESTSRATRGGGARGAARRELESRGKKFEVDDFIEAAEKNDVELLQVFFDAGMDANAKDQYGRTAIMGAAERGRIGAIKLLLEKGADPNYYPPSFDSPLLIAAQHGESEAIRVLVAGGANVDQPAGATQGGTPLTRAADVDQWDAVKALIDLGADPNLTYDSTTALFKAAEKGNEPIVRFLLEKGADPNKRAPGGASALWFPVWNGHTAVVKLLLEGGADLKKDRDMLLKGLGGKPLLPEIKKLLQNPPKARNMSTVPKRAAATKPVAVAAAPSKSDPAPSPKPSKATMSTPPGPDAGLAAGQAKGTFTMNGKATPLTHAYAIAEPGAFDKKKEDIRVILSNRELTKTNVEEWSDRMRLVDEGLECVEIVFNAEGNIISGEFRHKAKSFSSTGRHVFDKSVLNAQMVAGRLSAPEDEFFGTTYAYDAAFKANVIRKEKPKPVSPAAAAAATKSAPGVAYLAYVKALRAGDIPSLTKLVAKERAEMMKAPEFKEQLGLVQALMPKDIKIVDGKEEGATATLTLVGKEDASTSRGTATLVKEDGAWKVQKESWKGGD